MPATMSRLVALQRAAAIVGFRRAPAPRCLAAARRNFGSVRQLCLSDRESRKLMVHGQEVPVPEDYWKYVADETSVADAAEYQNNTENYIGTVKYPVGMIGPLTVNGEHSNRDYFVPMATHEGALLASYARGAKAITQAGGCTTRIKGRSMLRAPVFLFRRIAEATEFQRFALDPETQRRLTEYLTEHINHLKVNDLRIFQTGRRVHVSVGIDADNAAGQNKVTYAGDLMMQKLKEWYPKEIPEVYIEGGFNAGKRVSVLHNLLGKGHSVVVDCVIPKEVVASTLHTTPYGLQRFQNMHNRTNEYMGGLSCTAHVANGLAAFYIALGQDPACVAESQAAVTHFDVVRRDPANPSMEDCDLYASMTLNSIIVATVGGGTRLPSFAATQKLLGVESSNELAEVCAAVALSGELSFYAAMVSGEFTAAHWNMTHKG